MKQGNFTQSPRMSRHWSLACSEQADQMFWISLEVRKNGLSTVESIRRSDRDSYVYLGWWESVLWEYTACTRT
jgi:hypothetical protein